LTKTACYVVTLSWLLMQLRSSCGYMSVGGNLVPATDQRQIRPVSLAEMRSNDECIQFVNDETRDSMTILTTWLWY